MLRALTGPALIAYNGYDVGLGNRIRVVLGCQSLAELEARTLLYVWPTGARFGPEFSDLWDFTAGSVLPRAVSRLLARRWRYVDHRVPAWLDDAKRTERLWQIRTGSEVLLPVGAVDWRQRLREMVPVEEVRQRVRATFDAELRGAPYLGVMVRAHAVSHAETRRTSPADWYIARLEQLRRVEPGMRYFLSCDVPEVQDAILQQVPGGVAQADKGGYNTVAGVRSSVVDLYLLASGGHLIGPHYSSFVQLAVHLSGDRLQLETPVSGTGDSPPAYADPVADPLRPHLRG